MPKLIVLLNGLEVLARDLEPGVYTMGSDAASDILLEDPTIDKNHAKVEVGPENVKVVSAGASANLTADGEPVSEAELASGVSVGIGPFELKCSGITQGAASEPPAPGESTVLYGADQGFEDQATVVGSAPAAPAPPRAVLVVLEGSPGQAQYTLSPGATTVGRSEECGLHLADNTVSRSHAEFTLGPDRLAVSDAGSTSGVQVNDKPVKKADLAAGDKVRFGAVVLEVSEAPGGAAAAPAAGQAPPPPKEKKKKPKKKKAKPAQPAGLKSAKGGKRTLLYGALAGAILILVIAVAFSGGGKKEVEQVPVESKETQRQQDLETDQIQRMVIINLAKGKEAMQAKHYSEAIGYLRQVLLVDANHAEAKKILAEAEKILAQAEADRLKQEQEEAERVQKAGKLLNQTQQAWDAKDYAKTIEMGKQVLAVMPNHAVARHLVVQAQAAIESEKRRKQEEELYRKRRVALAGHYLTQAQAALKKKDLFGARAQLQKAVAADPKAESPAGAKAKKLLAKVEPKIKAKADALYKKGAALLKRGRLEKAVNTLRKALEVDPKHAKAAKALVGARKKAKKLAHDLYQKGKVLFSLGQTKKACSNWRRGLKLVESGDEVYASIKEKLAECSQ